MNFSHWFSLVGPISVIFNGDESSHVVMDFSSSSYLYIVYRNCPCIMHVFSINFLLKSPGVYHAW